MSRAVVADPRNSRRKYADTQIRHDDHPGSRRGGAWAAGSQIAAGCATVPRDAENVVIRAVAPDLGSCTRETFVAARQGPEFFFIRLQRRNPWPLPPRRSATAPRLRGSPLHDLPGRVGLSRRAIVTAAMAMVSSPVVTSGCCPGPRWQIVFAVGEYRQQAGSIRCWALAR